LKESGLYSESLYNKLLPICKKDVGIDFLYIVKHGMFSFTSTYEVFLIQTKFRTGNISLDDIATFGAMCYKFKEVMHSSNVKIIPTLFCNNELSSNADILGITNIIDVRLIKDEINECMSVARLKTMKLINRPIDEGDTSVVHVNNNNGNGSMTKLQLTMFLDRMTVEVLRGMCKCLKIKYANLRKDEMIPLIVDAMMLGQN
jgi:hypothetical protein